MNTSSWNPAVLLAALIPLVLGLQMTALWVIANAANPESPVPAQVAPLSAAQDLFEPQAADADIPSRAASATLTPKPTAAVPAAKQAALPRLEDDLASNVMIPVSLEPAAEPKNEQTTDPLAPPPQEQPGEAETRIGLQPPQWLRTRAAGHYTLQVERFSDLDSLKEFAATVALPAPTAYYVQNTGRTWYVLVAGDYDDQQAALQIATDLTRDHPAVKPWVRAYSEIQGQLP